MRYTPAALALSLLLAVSASVIHSAPPAPLAPAAARLLAEGRAEMASGNVDGAIDALEAALLIEPGHPVILLSLADATRKQGMQGKALVYYRKTLEVDPGNLMAISGEGTALVEKGAVEKARRNLTRLQSLCGRNCAATRQLDAAIAKGPPPRVVSAEAVRPEPEVSEN